jgi:hypothetical protein
MYERRGTVATRRSPCLHESAKNFLQGVSREADARRWVHEGRSGAVSRPQETLIADAQKLSSYDALQRGTAVSLEPLPMRTRTGAPA